MMTKIFYVLAISSIILILSIGNRVLGDEPTKYFPSIDGWTLKVEPVVYTPENLWDIIDGAAELFLSYGFVDLHIAEYHRVNGDVVRVEVYRHASLANSFGIYSQERNTDYHFVDIGTQGYTSKGILNFLCGIYYIKISSSLNTPEGQQAILSLGRIIHDHLRQPKGWPDVLQLFPADGREKNSETYIAVNFLGYRSLHSVFLAKYHTGTDFQLFIIKLGTFKEADEMLKLYLGTMKKTVPRITDARFEINDPHQGIVLLAKQDCYLYGVLYCSNTALGGEYLSMLDKNITRELLR